MERIILWLILLVTGAVLLYVMALRIQDVDKRKKYMMGTHLATVVPASVGIGNYFFQPDDFLSGVLCVVLTVGIVGVVWFGLRWVYMARQIKR